MSNKNKLENQTDCQQTDEKGAKKKKEKGAKNYCFAVNKMSVMLVNIGL